MRRRIHRSTRPCLSWCRTALFATLVAATACGTRMDAAADTTLLTTSGGDVASAPITAQGLDHTVTSESYRRWVAAERALGSIGVDDLAERIPTEGVTEGDVARIVAAISANARVREAIESAGIGVEEYVMTTLALEQALTTTNPDARVRYRRVPEENIILTDRYRTDIERTRAASPLRIAESERRKPARKWEVDSDAHERKRRGRGHRKDD